MLSLSKLKVFLNIDSAVTNQDIFLQDCIDESNEELNSITGRILNYKKHKLYYNGNGTKRLRLSQSPINAINVLSNFDGANYVPVLSGVDTIDDSLFIDSEYIEFKKNYVFKTNYFASGLYNDYFSNNLDYAGMFNLNPQWNKNIYIEFEAGYLLAETWTASHAYIINDLVLFNNIIYNCATPNNDAQFTINKWTALTAAPVPKDLERAVKYLAAKQYNESPAGNQMFMKTSMNVGGQSSAGFSIKDIMPEIMAIAKRYERINV